MIISDFVDNDLGERAIAKAKRFAEVGADISEFGTRRRFSFDVQDRVIALLKSYAPQCLKGLSNVFLSMKYSLIPMGR